MLSACRSPIRRAVLSTSLPHRVPTLQPGLRNISSNVNTVDASEIEHFSRLSSQWWDERGEFAPLHRMNPARMEFIRDKLQEIQLEEGVPPTSSVATPLGGLDILDVGCGGGLLSEVRFVYLVFQKQVLRILPEPCQVRCQDHRHRCLRSEHRDSFNTCFRRSPICSIARVLEVLTHNCRSVIGGGEAVQCRVLHGGYRACQRAL